MKDILMKALRHEYQGQCDAYITISDEDLDQMIDDNNDEINIGVLTYRPSEVLAEVDPVAYEEWRLEAKEMQKENLEDDKEGQMECLARAVVALGLDPDAYKVAEIALTFDFSID